MRLLYRNHSLKQVSNMKTLDPVTLKYFISICEAGSISIAAERESIVPSAISKRINSLEEELGVKLFIRDRRGIKTTSAGDALLRQSREILTMMNRSISELSEFATGVHGNVRVCAGLSALTEFLPEDISSFLRKHQSVRITLEEKTSKEVVQSVSEGVADIGVCWSAVDTRDLEVHPYHTDHLAIAVPIGHPLTKHKKVKFKDTLDFDHVGIISGGLMDLMLQRNALKLGKSLVHRVQVTTFDAACGIVAAKLGIAVVPREATQNYHSDRIELVDLDETWATRKFILCSRSNRDLSNASRILLEHLVEINDSTRHLKTL